VKRSFEELEITQIKFGINRCVAIIYPAPTFPSVLRRGLPMCLILNLGFVLRTFVLRSSDIYKQFRRLKIIFPCCAGGGKVANRGGLTSLEATEASRLRDSKAPRYVGNCTGCL
jgi:hypothetical protein